MDGAGADDIGVPADVPEWVLRLHNDYMDDIVVDDWPIQLLQGWCRNAVWTLCQMLQVDEYGIPGQACRLLELFLAVYIRDNVLALSQNLWHLLQFREELMAEISLFMVSCVQLAAKMSSSSAFLLQPSHLQEVMERCFEVTYSVGDIIYAEYQVYSALGYRVPVWTSTEAAQMLALHCGLPLTMMAGVEAVVNVCEVSRYQLNRIICGVAEVNRSFNVSRIHTLHLIAGSIEAAARLFGHNGEDPIPALARLTRAPETYLRCITDVILAVITEEA